MSSQVVPLALLLAALLPSCASGTKSPASATPAEVTTEAEVELVPEAERQVAPRGEASADPATPTSDEPAEAPREVRYHLTPEGLRVSVAGVTFAPKVTPIKVGAGWGVHIEVRAESTDGAPHIVYSPEQGPLAFYAIIERSGDPEKAGDARKGEGQQRIEPKKPLTFSRDWPPPGGPKPLTAGQKLELQVGLWGVGTPEDHRPLKQFFTVKMTAGAGKPQPQILPPDVK